MPLKFHHACNSLESLSRAFHDADADTETALSAKEVAIEVDVTWSSVIKTAVTGHTALSSDARAPTFKTWMDHFLRHKPVAGVKVLKLDIKNVDAMLEVVDVVRLLASELRGTEIWINSDLLIGPGGDDLFAPDPLDPYHFFTKLRHLPLGARLSLGWCTGWTPVIQRDWYTKKHCEEMRSLVQRFDWLIGGRPITFAVRASMYRDSHVELARLLEAIPGSSLTLWTWVEGLPQSDLELARATVPRGRLVEDCGRGSRREWGDPARWMGLPFQ